MKDKVKRMALIVVGLSVSALLVVMIIASLAKPKVEDVQIPSESSALHSVTPQTPDIVTPIETELTIIETSTSAIEQPIQADSSPKPTYSEAELENPEITPESVEAPPTPIITQPIANSGASIPGFDDVVDGGSGGQIVVDGDGDINTQVGIMG